MYKFLASLFMAALITAAPIAAADEDELHISEPSKLDLGYLQQQRDLMGNLVASEYGRRFQMVKRNDLELLQRVIDDRLIAPGQTRELQAMGVVMGDLLAKEHDLHWVIYEDKIGRSRALRYRNTDTFVFPMTMIARRYEVGNTESVADIYARAEAAIQAGKPPLPYQQ
ncbi:hypothetical protein GCM10007052_09300 [Halioglobus japonicus]|nr:DUF3806 domain-containing protein [Halioglobus japonicus]GHD10230.1 hypothetical protein GCM10007052_09300 [Halioglobus japonicus]